MNQETEEYIVESPADGIVYGIFIVMAGVVLPALLIPIVTMTGYSEVIEEFAKALVVSFLILQLSSHKSQIIGAVVFGFWFGLSENMLYLNQIFQLGDMSVFLNRFIWTLPMHILTILIMTFSGMAGRVFLVFGFVAAVILHAFFNQIIVSMITG